MHWLIVLTFNSTLYPATAKIYYIVKVYARNVDLRGKQIIYDNVRIFLYRSDAKSFYLQMRKFTLMENVYFVYMCYILKPTHSWRMQIYEIIN